MPTACLPTIGVVIHVVGSTSLSSRASLSNFSLCHEYLTLLYLLAGLLYALNNRRVSVSSSVSSESGIYLFFTTDQDKQILTAKSASTRSIRLSSAFTSAVWACSSLFLRSPCGEDAFSFSITEIYYARVEETAWNVAVIFQGLVETYIRGESKIDQKRESAGNPYRRLTPDNMGAKKMRPRTKYTQIGKRARSLK